MIDDDQMINAAKSLVARALRDSYFNAGEYSGISANGSLELAEAVEALIDAKLSVFVEMLAERTQHLNPREAAKQELVDQAQKLNMGYEVDKP